MSDYVKCNYYQISITIKPMDQFSKAAQCFISSSIRFRRNIKQAKLSDVTVLALLCW